MERNLPVIGMLTCVIEVHESKYDRPYQKEEDSDPAVVNNICATIDGYDRIATGLDEVVEHQLEEWYSKAEHEFSHQSPASHCCSFKETRVVVDINSNTEISCEAACSTLDQGSEDASEDNLDVTETSSIPPGCKIVGWPNDSINERKEKDDVGDDNDCARWNLFGGVKGQERDNVAENEQAGNSRDGNGVSGHTMWSR
jgi:hypothetical protein